jgi:hypothetical protein
MWRCIYRLNNDGMEGGEDEVCYVSISISVSERQGELVVMRAWMGC